jgi:hypothetical protein
VVGAAAEHVQQGLRADGHDPAAGGKLAQQQVLAAAPLGGLYHADDLGPAGRERHPGRVGPAGEGVGHGRGRVGDALQPDHPVGLAQPLRVRQADHPDDRRGAHPPVAPGHGLLGDADRRGNAAEGSAAVDDQGVDDLPLQQVETKRFHYS